MIHLIYDVFYSNASEPAMRVRETRDEVSGQVIYEDYYTGERVFLFTGDTEICMQLVSDISAEKTGLDFLRDCEACFTVINENYEATAPKS